MRYCDFALRHSLLFLTPSPTTSSLLVPDDGCARRFRSSVPPQAQSRGQTATAMRRDHFVHPSAAVAVTRPDFPALEQRRMLAVRWSCDAMLEAVTTHLPSAGRPRRQRTLQGTGSRGRGLNSRLIDRPSKPWTDEAGDARLWGNRTWKLLLVQRPLCRVSGFRSWDQQMAGPCSGFAPRGHGQGRAGMGWEIKLVLGPRHP